MSKNLDGTIPDEDDPFGTEKKDERRRRWRKWGTVIVVGLVLVLAAVASPYVVRFVERCGPGVDRIAGDCIGVTDGTVDFDTHLDAKTKKRLHEADQLIRKENKRVADEKHVTVAFLGALSITQKHNLTGGRAVNEIEGAAIAQRRANDGHVVGDSPKIKLVLANEGADQSHWKKVVDQLIEMRDSDHLVAVAGFGISTKASILAAQRLSGAHIAMVEDATSADGFDTTGTALKQFGRSGRINGLTRVAVPESQRVTAMANYLKGPNVIKPQGVKSADIVVDRKATDLYSQTLATSYHAAFRDALKAGGRVDEPLIADSPDQPGIKNQYDMIASNLNLCEDNPPDIVLYAGRTIFLHDLIGYLEHCQKQHITIVTGSDAEGITDFPPGDVSVLYTPSADADQLMKSRPSGYQGFVEDAQKYYAQNHYSDFSESSDLRDSWAIMADDAVLTVAKAIHSARGGDVPLADDVANTLYRLHEANYVNGASGKVEIDPNGNPLHPMISIVRLFANGNRQHLSP